MLQEVLAALAPRDGAIYLDGTFGAGGYSQALLEAADCIVWAIDRDPAAVARGRELAKHYDGRITVVEGRFGDMEGLLDREQATPLDGIALDLGVSSIQLGDADRGFSFQVDGPLDMRMDGGDPDQEAGEQGSAADVVMSRSEEELADIIFHYGEERRARQVARAIVRARRERPIERTLQLAEIVRSVVKRSGERGIDPATRTFQGLRIYVNDELGELERGLEAAERLLAPGGRLAVVSFHSLEDRITKNFLRQRCGALPKGSRHLPSVVPPCAPGGEGRAATFTTLFKGAQRPSEHECRENPRARSARLRAAERTAAPTWPGDNLPPEARP
jgi:16S rRNA (cytosine1402-N4)-methyltransferase